VSIPPALTFVLVFIVRSMSAWARRWLRAEPIVSRSLPQPAGSNIGLGRHDLSPRLFVFVRVPLLKDDGANAVPTFREAAATSDC
jgi:hypothetical protein